MMKKFPSIFNDVLSPVTPGPSSSNTCGPHRIASVCRRLLNEEPKELRIRMAEKAAISIPFTVCRAIWPSLQARWAKIF